LPTFTPDETKAIWEEFFSLHATELGLFTLADLYPDVRTVLIDFYDLVDFSSEFAEDILNHPEYYLKLGEVALKEYIEDYKDYHLRLKNVFLLHPIRVNDITSRDIGKLIKIDGTIRKVADARPLITVAAWKCSDCGGVSMVPTEEGKLVKPLKCAVCGKSKWKVTFKLLPSESRKVDFKEIEVQDNPENLGGSQQPRMLSLHLLDDLATTEISPGDRVEVIGIVKAAPLGSKNNPSAQMGLYMEVVNIEKKNKDWSSIEISESDEEEIRALSRKDNLIDLFKQSVAPSIWGHDIIKEALVLQLFGGVPKVLPGGTRKRGDIHILLVGDPGTAKSEILLQISRIAPRAIYTTGKGTSAAGLTAAAVKDKDNVWVLEAGALVIADKGMACIDEIDKMSEEDRRAIHTAMEQQIVTVDKAGIHTTLPARCSILAAANPVSGRFDISTSLTAQINLDPALLTRFDAIFKIVDIPDEMRDTAIARHLIDVHYAGEKNEDDALQSQYTPVIDVELLRKYVVYAKQIRPKMSEEAKKFIEKTYVKMRNAYTETGTVSITPRQLEAMIRFAEASARLRLSEVVTLEDAERAARIVEYYLKDVASDLDSGIIDIDSLYGGGKRIKGLMDDIVELVDDYGGLSRTELIKHFSDKYNITEIDMAIEALKRLGRIRIRRDTIYTS